MHIHRSVVTIYTAEQMYSLVTDVCSYPQFLPWCRGAALEILSATEARAKIELSYHGIERFFTTRNQMQPNQWLKMYLLNGPFRKLEGNWQFQPLANNRCKVTLDLEYEFSNWALGMLIQPIFHPLADNLVNAFHARAQDIYQKHS